MQELLATLGAKQTRVTTAAGLRGSSAALLIGRAVARTGRSALCVVPSEKHAAELEQDLQLFTTVPILLYPGYDIPPYTPLSPDPATVAARLATLYRAVNASSAFIFIAPAEALLRRVVPKERLTGLSELVIKNEETSPEDLQARLVGGGYEPVSLVQTVGEFCVRGGIIDIFPPAYEAPVRLDFFGDTVESIRLFDPISQRSLEELEEVELLPASDILFPAANSAELATLVARFRKRGADLAWRPDESRRILDRISHRTPFPGIEFFLPLFYEKPAAPLDFLPADALVFHCGPEEIKKSIELTWERITANHQESEAGQAAVLPPTEIFLTVAEFDRLEAPRTTVNLADFALLPSQEGKESGASTFTLTSTDHTLLKQHIGLERKKQGLLPALTATMKDWLQQGDSVIFSCHSERHAQHVSELLKQHGLPADIQPLPWSPEHMRQCKIVLYSTPLSQGFDLPHEKLHFLSESQLFGEHRLARRKRSTKKIEESDLRFEELEQGDIVVHRAHGLGVYQGLIHLTLNNVGRDFIQIHYLDDDKLYVPVDQIGAISKYKGLSDQQPAIDRLGGKSWAAAKKKVKEAVWQVAQDLLDLYARRELAQGRSFSPPDELYCELEESFPYDETPGQLKAINEVLADLTSEQPMDRLVCGDVGYGKTEVAVRAAFKVVADGHQVAMLVPTTVLAEQHAATFRERLQGFPVRIESLNRFRSAAAQKKLIQELAEGRIDIVIGTHRLLSKDVVFRKLGLLIVDEEHRFGVTHKERLKKLRTNVDVLTLTATPIPRTLQLSLLGVRDLSVISSPPRHRRTVKTFIARHDDLVIKEAVGRELLRGGQVFLVHNQVQSIQEVAFKVQKLVPDARIAVAHGQMSPKNLEEIMVRFINHEVDVLVCTTIIESGLDIPNANTIIITRADRLGLAEIYQLRGRVGRSREQAYAYLLVPSLDGLSKDARQRLRALMDYNDLGGGFKLAMSDLQIRGGGNILGGSQSGHIAAVGYDLYLDLLQKTVSDLKRRGIGGEQESEEIDPEINLQISAYIPDHYIPDHSQRYIAYRKITTLANDTELADLKNEFEDRYGRMPVELLHLLEIISLKMRLKAMKIIKLEQGKDTLVFSFHNQTPVAPATILELVNSSKGRIRFTPEGRLIVKETGLDSPAAIIAGVQKVLHAFLQSRW